MGGHWINQAPFHCKYGKKLCWLVFGIAGESLINEHRPKSQAPPAPKPSEQRYLTLRSPIASCCSWRANLLEQGGTAASSQQVHPPENFLRLMPGFETTPWSPAIKISPANCNPEHGSFLLLLGIWFSNQLLRIFLWKGPLKP